MKRRKAIVAGLACLDIAPIFGEKKVHQINELLKPGKLINVDRAHIYPGGAVSNTGLAMKLMGIDTCLIGKTGADHFGDIIESLYQKYDAHRDLIRDSQAPRRHRKTGRQYLIRCCLMWIILFPVLKNCAVLLIRKNING